MFYIEIQQIDYDDYPVGSPTKIGPFETKAASHHYMETNCSFFYRNAYGSWKSHRWPGRHAVKVRELTSNLIDPETYLTYFS